jgi:AraC-like DNA-binding protein
MKKMDPLHRDERSEGALPSHIGERWKPAPSDDASSKLARDMCLIVGAPSPQPPSLRETARRLAMTPRTLQRRLRSEGVSHRELVEHMRKHRAVELLTTTALRIEAVAAELGFSDAAAFQRAFGPGWASPPAAFDASPAAELANVDGVVTQY